MLWLPLLPLGRLMLDVYLTMAIFIFGVLGLVCRLWGFRLLEFLRFIKDEILLVLGTSSSEAALPRIIAGNKAFEAGQYEVAVTELSAAYAIASSAERIIVTETGGVGSIGVIALHTGGDTRVTGLLLVLCAALSWAAGNIVATRAKGVNALAYVVWASAWAIGPLLGLSLLVEGWPAIRSSLAAAGPEAWAAVLAQYPMQAPSPAAFRADGKALVVDQKIESVPDGDWLRKELVFTLPAAQAGQRVRILWGTPRAGSDGIPLTDKAFVAHYCIDAGTAKALRKADGYVSQHLRLNSAAYEGKQGVVIVRVEKPSEDLAVSLCADGVKKTAKTLFEVKLPPSAPFVPSARGGRRLPILFGLHI